MRLSSFAGMALFLVGSAATMNAREGPGGFSGEWKTRYEWDPAELAAIAAAAAGQRPPELDKKGEPEPPA